MADGMPGMPWKEALKRLKEYHQAGADGSPASMQKELEGLEESLKGWETRDERRDRTLNVYRQDAEKLRAERGELTSKLESEKAHVASLIGTLHKQDEELHQLREGRRLTDLQKSELRTFIEAEMCNTLFIGEKAKLQRVLDKIDGVLTKPEPGNSMTFCLHLAAFGCAECKAIVECEIEKERMRCAKLAEEFASYAPHAKGDVQRESARLIADEIRRRLPEGGYIEKRVDDCLQCRIAATSDSEFCPEHQEKKGRKS